jgi:phosphatidylglycerophosphate synthase
MALMLPVLGFRVLAVFGIATLLHTGLRWAATASLALLLAAVALDWVARTRANERKTVTPFHDIIFDVVDRIFVLGSMISILNAGYLDAFKHAAVALLLCLLCREFAIAGLKTAAASRGVRVGNDRRFDRQQFLEIAAIGLLLAGGMVFRDPLISGWRESESWQFYVTGTGFVIFLSAVVLSVATGVALFRTNAWVLSS